jgi:hypothetical protein
LVNVALGGERDGQVPQAVAGQEVGEDAAHDGRLGFVDDQICGAVGAAGDASVAVGDLGGQHLPGPGTVELAAPSALGELGPFVFGDDTLDLHQQAPLWVVEGWGVGEADRHLVAGELVQDQDLVGVGAGQPIRGQAPDGVDGACFGGVAQPVQAGAVQPGPGVAVIDELVDQFVALGGDTLAQRLQLRADRRPRSLGVGRHSGVDAHSHDRLLALGRLTVPAHPCCPEAIRPSGYG